MVFLKNTKFNTSLIRNISGRRRALVLLAETLIELGKEEQAS